MQFDTTPDLKPHQSWSYLNRQTIEDKLVKIVTHTPLWYVLAVCATYSIAVIGFGRLLGAL